MTPDKNDTLPLLKLLFLKTHGFFVQTAYLEIAFIFKNKA